MKIKDSKFSCTYHFEISNLEINVNYCREMLKLCHIEVFHLFLERWKPFCVDQSNIAKQNKTKKQPSYGYNVIVQMS